MLTKITGALPGAGGEGHLYIQRRQDKQGLRRPRMAGRDVFPHLEQGRADDAVLRVPKKCRQLQFK